MWGCAVKRSLPLAQPSAFLRGCHPRLLHDVCCVCETERKAKASLEKERFGLEELSQERKKGLPVGATEVGWADGSGTLHSSENVLFSPTHPAFFG